MSERPASSEMLPPTAPVAPSSPRWRQALKPFASVPTPVLFLVAAAIAVVFLARRGRLAEIEPAMRSVSPWMVTAILTVYAASIVLLCVRWQVLTRLAGGDPPFMKSAEVFLTSVIVNYAAPIGLAVPTRAALTVRDLGLAPAQSAAVVGWELIMDAGTLLLIGCFWLVFGGLEVLPGLISSERMLLVLVLGVTVMVLAVATLLFIPKLRRKLVEFVLPLLRYPVERPGEAVQAIVLTVIYWLMQMATMSALLIALGVPFSVPLITGLMGFPVLIGMVSPVPGGAGIREALMAAAAQVSGVASAPVILAAVAYRLALFIVTPVIWSGLWLVRRIVARNAS